jgi:hypothetical protein
MIVNYKTIIQDLSGIAYHHEQIKSFGYGDITQVTMDIETKKEPLYTRMYVVPGDVTLNQNRLDYNFSIIIMDRINNDLSNQEDVMNDTLLICQDLFTILYQSYTANWGGFSIDYEPLWGPNVTPFLERFETILGGWTMNLTIEQPFDYNQCVLPFTSGVTLPNPNQVQYVNYKQLLGDLKSMGDNHPQIKSYGFGDIEQLTNDIVTDKSPLYTRMYVVPTDTFLNRYELVYSFQIIVADRLNDDYSNQRDVMNDTLEIIKDIFTKLYLSQYQSIWGSNVSPFLERFEDILAGWTLTINLTQPFDYNRCIVPERSFLPGKKWFELAELWNEISKDWNEV